MKIKVCKGIGIGKWCKDRKKTPKVSFVADNATTDPEANTGVQESGLLKCTQ
jgi:hypothetical protein